MARDDPSGSKVLAFDLFGLRTAACEEFAASPADLVCGGKRVPGYIGLETNQSSEPVGQERCGHSTIRDHSVRPEICPWLRH